MLFALVVAELAAGLETTLMFAALPTAMRVTHRSLDVAWLITGYLLVSAAAAAACARLGDLYGRSRVLLIILALSAGGSMVSALSPSLEGIIFGRAVQGLSGAVLPLCYGVLRENLPAKKVPLGIGLISAANSFSAAAGFVIGGMIVDNTEWQQIFSCSAILCSLGFLLSWHLIPVSPRRACAVDRDLLGGLLFSPAVAALLWALDEFQRSGSGEAAPWLWLGGSIAGLLAWALHEWRHPSPLIDVKLLANRNIIAVNLAVACASLGALQVLQVFPVLMQQPAWTGIGFGLSATMMGLLKLPSNLASVIGASWGGALCAKTGSERIVLSGAILSFLAWTILRFDHSSLWFTIGLVCLSSAGFTTLFTGVVNVIVELAPDGRTSEATAMTVTIRTVAQSIGGQIILALFSSTTISSLPGGPSYPAPAAHRLVLTYLSLASAGALLASVYLLLARGRDRITRQRSCAIAGGSAAG